MLCSTAGRRAPASPYPTATGSSCTKRWGWCSQVFNEHNLSPLQGHIAIGHTRYSTADSSRQVSAQPFLLESALGPVALAHNGNLVNTEELRQELFGRGVGLVSSATAK